MIKLGTQTNSLINHALSKEREPIPEIGMGASILHWTDRTACTIIEVAPKQIVLQEDYAIRTNGNNISDDQEYKYTPNPAGRKHIFTLRKNSKWVRKGDTQHGTTCVIGYRTHYYDYSF